MNKTMFLLLIIMAFACTKAPDNMTDDDTDNGHDHGDRGEHVMMSDPTWPIPDGGATVKLSQNSVAKKGELIKMEVTLNNLKLLTDKNIPGDFAQLIIVVTSETPETVRFSDGAKMLEHAVDVSKITEDGSYSFSHELIGYKPGAVNLILNWKWPILTEGCCSTALLAILAGCNNNAACICATMAAMPNPGAWCCSIHPKVFRYYWSFYGCAGPSPY